MKETVKTSRTAGQLEKMYRALNRRYYENQLPEVIITIQSTPRAYGHLTVNKAWKKGDGFTYELNIGAGTLDRPIENIVATMQHEMVHLYNILQGVQDCSRGGAYHNKRFKKAAEERDLIISYDSRIGWSITEPADGLLEFVLEHGFEDLKMSRIEWYGASAGINGTLPKGTGTPTPTGRTNHSRKYICPCCRNSVRATKAVNIICADCNELMKEE